MKTWGASNKNRQLVGDRTMEHLRQQAVAYVLAGRRAGEVAQSLGVHRTSVTKWLIAYKQGGLKALKNTVTYGPQPKLNERRKQQVKRWILGNSPRKYGFDGTLWTRNIIAEMIRRRFGVLLTTTSVGRLLACLDIRPPKPLSRALVQNPNAAQKWKIETYPRLRDRAQQQGADILFLDLGGAIGSQIRNVDFNAISVVDMKRRFWFKLYTGRLIPTMLGDAFACLTKECRTPAILVAHEMPENLRKIAVDHAMASEGRLEICYLEACGPASPSCEPASNHSQQGEPSIPTSLNKNNSPGSNQRL